MFAPFWRQPGHVGNYRIDRYLRWLAGDGFFVVLVRGGSIDRQIETEWGVEITVRDALGLFRDSGSPGESRQSRKPNRARRWLATRLFNPDASIVWARIAAGSRRVRNAAAGSSFVLSSSPPESAHLGAARLASALRTRLILDLRDGWLDDPLKPLLRDSRVRRCREGRLERRVLRQADRIFVTSSVWKRLLEDRLPLARGKSVILTNGLPTADLIDVSTRATRPADEPIQLVHAGRFTGSRLSQKVHYLLEPLTLGLEAGGGPGEITLLGDLEEADLAEIEGLRPVFRAKGWTISLKSAVSRKEMMSILGKADGHLLLSASEAALPSKMYEYLALGLPVFAATPQSSALWEVGASLEQLFVTDYTEPDTRVAKAFIDACRARDQTYELPVQFTEKVLRENFLQAVREAGAGNKIVET